MRCVMSSIGAMSATECAIEIRKSDLYGPAGDTRESLSRGHDLDTPMPAHW
jgi:hypothetical protein